MNTHLQAIVPTAVLTALALIYMVTGLGYETDTRAVPLVVTGVTLVLLVLDFLSQGNGRLAFALRRFFGGAAMLRPGQGGESAPVAKEIAAFAWMAAFTALATLFGFYLAIPVYVFAYLRFYAGKPLLPCVAMALGLTASLYITFEYLLGYAIFEGLLFGGYI
ncbi:tripartite tricarboxylate transporter TctB family protein [Puniceibacterium confluentis]|uniref:tripartite tricarboxylate transporter TctB family protein n=1 Tax=Puniceibacterium confluentis TaxID=1958944 RepID=UPI0011B5706A|nr:tripartite tricarboxylate transporter TctB family protein [Puniceibacterium confluentis]